ncbi:6-phosphofructo-2-kinase/fructose-2,6-bisphosphatase isoform X3 [Oryza sativa Japonica Group]|uniref:6-phosphofructo-2-kinase/fructose-2, 6-bisphosphatase isoform X3 n=1 Tax=Oryza sativa subsp. japonica TaxID=39947 RepID=UPI00339C27F3
MAAAARSSGGMSDQLFVSIKLECPRLAEMGLVPHVFGSHPVAGAWDPSKALLMEQEEAALWGLSCIVPSHRETLDFKFLLKPKDNSSHCIVEEGPDRSLVCGSNEVEIRNALFKFNDETGVVECKIFVETEILSPFDLAASWKAHQEHLQPRVRGAHDVIMNADSESRAKGADGRHVPPQEEQRAIFVDRGVGSPEFARPTNETISMSNIKFDSEAKQDMPAAEGAVAAAAVADQMYGPKEDRKLAIVLVGLPARGKTFTAAKLTRYLRWLGHETKHFNVGKYRRLKHGINQTADFFRGDNKEGVEARNEVAALAMEDMLSWMQEGGQVGIFDATNSTRNRRNMLMKMAEGKCKIIFLETICNDQNVLERNMRLKVQRSPDYAEQTDFEAGVRDFKERLAYYEKVYEPVEEGSYVKMIDMVSGTGGQLQINDISGYLPGRIVFFLVNCHLTPRPILLTRHGESLDNVRGRIGGDSSLSETGSLYSRKLASFIEKRLASERTASIWTSTLQRSILTAQPIIGFPKIQWRALDEINAGICDGMTYDEIKKIKPEEYESRSKDKLRYRYPRGESYLDVIQRLEPVIIELERQRAPVVVISHQAVLRALYAYFADKPLEELPNIEIPLHTIIEIQMGVAGVQEKRYKLMDAVNSTAGI